ncbi:MAG TPA: copper chaperone PCu(A)C [Burkholderiales bacterium]|nr:copper chaperone PCu(A)C [Burkholderiales bacterium]
MKKYWMTLAVVGATLFSINARAQISVDKAWVRGTVQGQTSTGAFMSLKSAREASVVGAESPVAGSVQIHEMKMEGDVMKMRPVPRLALPAGKTVEFKPGGYHVMLTDLKRPLKKGESVPIRLRVQDKNGSMSVVEIKAEVRELGASGPH